MPRKKRIHRLTSPEKVEQRQQEALKLFMKNPDLSIPKMNEQLVKKGFPEIRTQNAYPIRRVARQMLADQDATGALAAQGKQALQAAARDPGAAQPAPSGNVRAAIIQISGPAHAGAVQDALKQLQEQGVNVRVPFATSTYLVAEIIK